MTDMKQSIKITVASISALVLAVACIVAAPLLKDVLNDIVNPAYSLHSRQLPNELNIICLFLRE